MLKNRRWRADATREVPRCGHAGGIPPDQGRTRARCGGDPDAQGAAGPVWVDEEAARPPKLAAAVANGAPKQMGTVKTSRPAQARTATVDTRPESVTARPARAQAAAYAAAPQAAAAAAAPAKPAIQPAHPAAT